MDRNTILDRFVFTSIESRSSQGSGWIHLHTDGGRTNNTILLWQEWWPGPRCHRARRRAAHSCLCGAVPHVCSVCGEAFRSDGDLDGHAARSHPGEVVTGNVPGAASGTTTQLGGGVASPMLWRVYCAILATASSGAAARTTTKYTLPCLCIPCVHGNMQRIRDVAQGLCLLYV